MHLFEVEGDRRLQQVKRAIAAHFAAHGGVDVRQHLVADNGFTQRLLPGLLDRGGWQRRVELLVGLQQCEAQRHEHLQVQLLAQQAFLDGGSAVPAQARHQRIRCRHAGIAQRAGEGGQDELLDHIQQDVIARNLEAVTEALVRHDVRVGAGATAGAPIQAVIGNHQVCGAAADVDGRQGDLFVL
ncbi:hypothetical protein D3C76_1310880 [compost metagenome]